MRLLIEAYACQPGGGSEGGNGWNLAAACAQRGCRVRLVVIPQHQDAIIAACAALRADDPAIDLEVWPVAVPAWAGRLPHTLAVYARYQAWLRAVPSAIADRVRAFAPDLALHHTWGSVQGGTQLWRLGIPTVLGPAGGGQTAPPGSLRFLHGGRLLELARTALVRASCWPGFRPGYLRQVQGVVASNRETAAYVTHGGGRVLGLLPDAALPTDFRPAAPPERVYDPHTLSVLWLARLLPRKAVQVAVEAWEQLPPDSPARLTIVGDGPQGSWLRQRLATSTARHRITWLGRIPWEAVREQYRQADLFLFTSLRDSCAAQFFEAQCWGLPILAFDLPGARDHLDPASLRLIPFRAATAATDLAQAIEALRLHPAQRQTMATQAYAASAHHDWPHAAERLLHLLEPLIRPTAP